MVRKGTRWKIGDGNSVRVWGTPWLNSNEGFYVQMNPVPGFEDLMVSDLILPGTYLWDVELISAVFDPVDVSKILKTAISPFDTADKIIWH